jgi:hypothetical protein
MTFGSDLDVEIPGHTRGEMAAAAIENYVAAEIPARTTLQIWTVHGSNLLGVASVDQLSRECLQTLSRLHKIRFGRRFYAVNE